MFSSHFDCLPRVGVLEVVDRILDLVHIEGA